MYSGSSHVLRTSRVHNARHRRASPCKVHAATGTYTNKDIWDALKLVHVQQVPGMRFSAYNELFSVVKGATKRSPPSLRASRILSHASRSSAPPL
jgi:hypothetical protein